MLITAPHHFVVHDCLLIYVLFKSAFNNSGYTASDDRMISE